jgi:hypothetical protein
LRSEGAVGASVGLGLLCAWRCKALAALSAPWPVAALARELRCLDFT